MTNRAGSGRDRALLSSGAGRRQIAAYCTGGRGGRPGSRRWWGTWALRLGMGLAPERYRSLREMTTALICPAFSGLLSPAIRAAAGPRVVWKRSRMGILSRGPLFDERGVACRELLSELVACFLPSVTIAINSSPLRYRTAVDGAAASGQDAGFVPTRTSRPS